MGIFNWILNKILKEKKDSNDSLDVQNNYSLENVTSVELFDVSFEQLRIDKETIKILKNKFISLDVETTGLNPISDRVIEIGASLFVNGDSVEHFESLINIGEKIPKSAQKINHISDEMLADSPKESVVISDFVKFLGDALEGDTIVCAHNAKFDLRFIAETLKRNGYSGHFYYIDTLSLTRRYVKNLVNYKQGTIMSHFGISSGSSHRALADAEGCGRILLRTMDIIDSDFEKEEKRLLKTRPSQEELEICAFIQNSIVQRGGESTWMGFYKNSSNYIDVSYIFTLIKFKFAKKGNYIIVESKDFSDSKFHLEPCTMSEGGADFVRFYFNTIHDLEPVEDYLYKIYKQNKPLVSDFFKHYTHAEEEAKDSIPMQNSLDDNQIEKLLRNAKSKVGIKSSNEKDIFVKKLLKREEYQIVPTNNRVSLENIKNKNNWNKGFDDGYKFWEHGEALRKEGNLLEAIKNFDLARQNGYAAPALYNSYAMTYRKLKDYANEICILDEGILRNEEINNNSTSKFITRRDSALQLYLKRKDKEENSNINLNKGQQTEIIEQKLVKNSPEEKKKNSGKREVIQLTSGGVYLDKYESVAQAVRETGINSKSIRDAANGVQKHAGGYKWKFSDTL